MTATFWFFVTMTIFIMVCLILILLILIQKGRGGGLASAFGGAGGQTAFGSKTGDVLTWATSVVFAVFVVLAVALNLLANHIDNLRGGGANKPVVAATPVLPSSPQSSLPKAPTGDPGVAHPPPAANPTAEPTTLPDAQSISPATMPSMATTKTIIDRVPISSTFPATMP